MNSDFPSSLATKTLIYFDSRYADDFMWIDTVPPIIYLSEPILDDK